MADKRTKRYDPPLPATVVWEDAHRQEEAHLDPHAVDLEDPTLMTQRGYIFAENTGAVFMAAAVSSDGWVADVNRIPRGCVKSIWWEKVEE